MGRIVRAQKTSGMTACANGRWSRFRQQRSINGARDRLHGFRLSTLEPHVFGKRSGTGRRMAFGMERNRKVWAPHRQKGVDPPLAKNKTIAVRIFAGTPVPDRNEGREAPMNEEDIKTPQPEASEAPLPPETEDPKAGPRRGRAAAVAVVAAVAVIAVVAFAAPPKAPAPATGSAGSAAPVADAAATEPVAVAIRETAPGMDASTSPVIVRVRGEEGTSAEGVDFCGRAPLTTRPRTRARTAPPPPPMPAPRWRRRLPTR